MELIFLYINHSKTGFIKKQGINLNPHYCFEVTYENGVYTLNQKKKSEVKDCNFFDETGCISNVTAIVGENGSGKTTLLNQFMISYGGVKENIIGREIYNFNRYEDVKRIAIYVENGDVIIFHNIENLNVSQNLKDKEHYLYKGSKELSSIIKENKEFENISRFFITNNYLGEMANTISIHDSISDIYMNISSLHNCPYNVQFQSFCVLCTIFSHIFGYFHSYCHYACHVMQQIHHYNRLHSCNSSLK